VQSGVQLTVTAKSHVSWRPVGSVAVQVTCVAPTGKDDPEAGEQLMVTGEQLSVADTLKSTVTPAALVAACVIGAGQEISGAVSSVTVTVNEQSVAPAALAAVQVTVVAPTGKVSPLAWSQLTVPQSEEALKATAAPHIPAPAGTC
jgi:hypothetical protein